MYFKVLNGTPYIADFYRLRHQVFNQERGFNLPHIRGFETDEFDQFSIAVGVINSREVVAALRLIPRTGAHNLPMEVMVNMSPNPSEVPDPVEVSRLVLRPHSGPAIVRVLIAAMLDTARGVGASHLFAAMEPALVVGMKRFGLEFEQIGDEFEWHGRVRPYVKTLH